MILCFYSMCGGFVYCFEAYCEEVWVCWKGVNRVMFIYVMHVGFGVFGEFGAQFIWPVVGVCYGIAWCDRVISFWLSIVV